MKPCRKCGGTEFIVRKKGKRAGRECVKCRAEANRRAHMFSRYGITADDYDGMLRRQKGCCKLCKQQATTHRRRLVVDHCHTTGVVRGLLCDRCNLTLGQHKDDAALFARMAAYLRRHAP